MSEHRKDMKRSRRGRPVLYDWGALFARPKFTLKRGRHYRCSQSSITQQIRTHASKLGIRVSVVDHDKSVQVEVHRDA